MVENKLCYFVFTVIREKVIFIYSQKHMDFLLLQHDVLLCVGLSYNITMKYIVVLAICDCNIKS